MSAITVTVTGQSAVANTDRSNIFLNGIRTAKGNIANATGSAVTVLEGTVMGRIGSTDKLTPFTSGANDGSQHPIGILADTYIIPASSSLDVFMVNGGDVAADKLLFQGADSLETIISSRRVKDLLRTNGMALQLISSTELTKFDN